MRRNSDGTIAVGKALIVEALLTKGFHMAKTNGPPTLIVQSESGGMDGRGGVGERRPPSGVDSKS